jgi:tRNA A37 N6-isopentenylltransferase MiaA
MSNILKAAFGVITGGGSSMMMPLILGGGLLLVVGGSYLYINSLRAELSLQVEINGKLDDAIKARDIVMESQRKDLEFQKEINKSVSEQWSTAQKEKRDLEEKFRRVANLAEAAAKNPSDTERKLNRGTQYALRCNEIITGAPIEDGDKQNTICPDLIKNRSAVK